MPFEQWDTVFPNAACAVALIDRLTHHAEIISIDGEPYRKREAEQHQKRKQSISASACRSASDRAIITVVIPARAVVGRGIRYNRGRDVFLSHEPTVSWRRSLPSG